MAHIHTAAPSAYLAEHIDLLKQAPDKTALDIACGKGRNSLFLAENGFETTGLELNDDALSAARSSAEAKGLKVNFEKTDLEADGFELPIISHGVVCVFYFLYRPLLTRIRNAVKPGGFIIYETFLIDAHQRFGSPKRAEFAFAHNELLETFAGFRVHHYAEKVDAQAETACAQIIAQRV